MCTLIQNSIGPDEKITEHYIHHTCHHRRDTKTLKHNKGGAIIDFKRIF